MRLASFCALSLLVAPAYAVDIPIQGAYGADAVECRAARESRPGAYVVFSGARVGEGAKGDCEVSVIRKIGPHDWALIGACADPQGTTTTRTLRLARHRKHEIEYEGRRYKSCGP